MDDATSKSQWMTGRTFGTRIVVLSYVLALAAALATLEAMADSDPVMATLWADVVATIVVFAFSFAFRNSSFYDAYWSVGPMVIAVYWALMPAAAVGAESPWLRQLLVVGCVWLWGARLTFNWWRGWTGLAHEDWRYVDLQEKCGSLYWPVSFSGIHMFPTLIVFAGCMPLLPALNTGSAPIGWLDFVALAVTVGAVWIEARADVELRRFRTSDPPAGAVLNTGLWRLSRHPNYFGEMAFWWGLGLFGLAAAPGTWWVFAGALAITLMFQVVSLPMIETRMLSRRPSYAEVIQSTRKVLPLPRN